MDKLIELLNEYEKEKNPKTEYRWFSSYYKPLCYGFKVPFQGWHDNGEDYSEEIATSKQYGFIKWLVDNDKIDLDKVEQEAMSWFTDESPVYGNEIWTDRLIMILSVSNNPISDLIYYLKE